MYDSPDDLANALKFDSPVRKPEPGLWAGSGKALLTGAAAAAMDVGSVLLSMPSPQVGRSEVGARVNDLRERREAAARTLRGVAKELTPHPDATGEAAAFIHNMSRVLTKAVPLGLVGGMPAAAIGTGAIEGTVEAQHLQDEGVDPATARKVGLTKAATTAVQVALPLSGTTKLGTAALAFVGGPGGYMAEHSAVRHILESANYGEIAKRYDPFDPAGLAFATVFSGALGVGGHAVRSARAGRAKREAADAEAQARLGVHESTPEMQAAARVWQASDHVQETGLHRPGDLAAGRAHVDALEAALRSIDTGDRVQVSGIVKLDALADAGPESAKVQAALDTWTEQAARQQATEQIRVELIGDASMRADAGVVRQLEQERAPIEQQLATLEDSFKDRAKAWQEAGLSRKQAEAQARKEIADKRVEGEGQLRRIDQQLESNRLGSKAEQDLAAVESGDIPKHLLAQIDERVAQARAGVQRKPVAAAVSEAFPETQAPALVLREADAPAVSVELPAARDVATDKAPDTVTVAAKQAAEQFPDAMVPHPETGVLTAAKQLLKDAEETFRNQVRDAKAYQAAVTCFLGR